MAAGFPAWSGFEYVRPGDYDSNDTRLEAGAIMAKAEAHLQLAESLEEIVVSQAEKC